MKNYTGDVINFKMAAEIVRLKGINVEIIHVGDDIAFDENKRGLAGTVLVYKILGAAAQQGMNLQQLKVLGNAITKNIQTLGVSLTSCAIPGNEPTFKL